jgi:hypothetical protein
LIIAEYCLFVLRAQLDRQAIIAGLEGQGRIQGVVGVHPPNGRQPVRDLGNRDVIALERPVDLDLISLLAGILDLLLYIEMNSKINFIPPDIFLD